MTGSAAGKRIRHSACRRALIAGELRADLAVHLETCRRCAAFARDLAQAGEYAQALRPDPMPAGLPERLITRLQSDRPAGD